MDTNPDESDPLPPSLRWLKTLVTVLTVTMIFGLLTIVALLVIRLAGPASAPAPATLQLPASISMPEGHRALSFTQGPDWFAVVSDQNEIFIFDGETGDLRQQITISD